MTYRIDWSRVVDASLLRGVARRCGAPGGGKELRSLLVGILRSCGGFPFVEEKLDTAAMAEKVLHSAVKHALAKTLGPKVPRTRYHLVDARAKELGREVAAVVPINVNYASLETLRRLPVSAALARRIAETRSRRGPYRDIADLVRRVEGIGPEKGAKLAAYLRFDAAEKILFKGLSVTGDFGADLAALLSLQAASAPKEKMLDAFRLVLDACRRAPNPYNHFVRARPFGRDALPRLQEARFVGNLPGREYHDYLLEAIAGAKKSVKVAMFHMALGGQGHPTRKLVDALIARRRRGVKVQVLLDEDRKKDPYLSTIINSKARKYLEAGGVEVRYDLSFKLFHSKFLAIDDDVAVIGSHNWTTGSLFEADDLSVTIKSRAFNQVLRKRFDKLYAAAHAQESAATRPAR